MLVTGVQVVLSFDTLVDNRQGAAAKWVVGQHGGGRHID